MALFRQLKVSGSPCNWWQGQDRRKNLAVSLRSLWICQTQLKWPQGTTGAMETNSRQWQPEQRTTPKPLIFVRFANIVNQSCVNYRRHSARIICLCICKYIYYLICHFGGVPGCYGDSYQRQWQPAWPNFCPDSCSIIKDNLKVILIGRFTWHCIYPCGTPPPNTGTKYTQQ